MQQFKLVNKKKSLANTPAGFWVKAISFGIVSGSVLFGVYFYNYQAESFFGKISSYTDKFTQTHLEKQTDKRDKALQQHAYSNYLKEKKLYQKELDKETQQRLERLKQTLLTQTEPQTQNTPIVKAK